MSNLENKDKNNLIYKKILKKYNDGKILFSKLCDAKWKYGIYTKKEKKEFESLIKNKDWSKNVIEKGKKLFPSNKMILDYDKNFMLPANYLKYNKKKLKELVDSWSVYGKDSNNNDYTLQEYFDRFKPITSESKGEWDLINKDKKIKIEFANCQEAGSLTRTIQKELDSGDIPIYDKDEIFNEFKKILKKKISKETSCLDYNHLIILNTKIVLPNSKYSLIQSSRGTENILLSKYNEEVMKYSKEKFYFKSGKLIMSAGEWNAKILIYNIKNFFLDEKYEIINNDKNVFLTSIGNDISETKQANDFVKRIIKKDKMK